MKSMKRVLAEVQKKFITVLSSDNFIKGLITTYDEKIPLVFTISCCYALKDAQGIYSTSDVQSVVKRFVKEGASTDDLAETDVAYILADYENDDEVNIHTDVIESLGLTVDEAKFKDWIVSLLPTVTSVYLMEDDD